MEFRDELTFPSPRNVEFSAESFDDDELDEYEEFHQAWQTELSKHRLLGHHWPVQDDAREDFVRPINANVCKEWVLLMECGSDSAINANWADAGALYFFINRSDLAKKEFSRVQAALQSN